MAFDGFELTEDHPTPHAEQVATTHQHRAEESANAKEHEFHRVCVRRSHADRVIELVMEIMNVAIGLCARGLHFRYTYRYSEERRCNTYIHIEWKTRVLSVTCERVSEGECMWIYAVYDQLT